MAAGEVGKVGVPICHIADMEALFDGIPLAKMNTSMTINATAAWLLALYVAAAERQGADAQRAARHDPERHHQGVPLARHVHLSARAVAAPDRRYHRVHGAPHPVVEPDEPVQLPPAGSGRDAGAGDRLHARQRLHRARSVSRTVPDVSIPDVVGQLSFFVNAGIRFIEEMCKLKAFARLWDRLTRDRYGVADARKRRFRYGVQVNSLGLTAQQPENNVQRIVLEMLAVTLSKEARARSVQLPAWNEALGLPRPWDQQWSLRIQQVMAFETDLLEYDRDIFDRLGGDRGSKVAALMAEVDAELARIESLGGAAQALDVMKQALVASHAERQRRIESNDLTVVGVNAYTEHEPSPLTAGDARAS